MRRSKLRAATGSLSSKFRFVFESAKGKMGREHPRPHFFLQFDTDFSDHLPSVVATEDCEAIHHGLGVRIWRPEDRFVVNKQPDGAFSAGELESMRARSHDNRFVANLATEEAEAGGGVSVASHEADIVRAGVGLFGVGEKSGENAIALCFYDGKEVEFSRLGDGDDERALVAAIAMVGVSLQLPLASQFHAIGAGFDDFNGGKGGDLFGSAVGNRLLAMCF